MNPPHVLIVEDNPKNLNILARLLSDQGVTNTAITNPNHLDAAFEAQEKFDLIFLDLEMPGLSGYDVLKQLKEDARFADVPFVACTVHTGEMNRAHELGFDSFIAKPIDSDRFPEQLSRILSGTPVWDRT